MAARNGRYGGGSAGPEHRFSFDAVDTDQFETAKRGATPVVKWQGEAGQVLGAYVNTMDVPRGKIMGATIDCCWPANGFKS